MSGISVGESLLGTFLEATHLAAPDDLGPLIAGAVGQLGAADVAVYLVDHAQVVLQPLAIPGTKPRQPQDVDGTLAGRVFRTLEVREGTGDTGRRVWLPLLNGTERIGVLEVVFATDEPVEERTRERLRHLAALIAELLVAKGAYGDVFELSRRTGQVSLPAEVQRRLLPPLTLITEPVVIAAAIEPAYDAAGDAFDYAHNGDVVHFAVFDAMGHGLEAALLATVAIASYRHGRRAGLDLAATLKGMDVALSTQFGSERFVTALLGQLDLPTGRVRVLNAGHPPPLLVRKGKVVRHLAGTPALPVGLHGGAVEATEVTEESLEPGDRILALTDGVVEARSPEGEFFGEQRLVDLLEREMASGLPVPEAMRRLNRAVLAHQQGRLQDDATLLFVEWRGTS